MRTNRIITILLTTMLAITMFAGCKKQEEAQDGNPPASNNQNSQADTSISGDTVASILPDFTQEIEQALEKNEDTVGWLRVPDTPIEDVVLQKPDNFDNQYYLRKDFNKNYNFNGVFYADFRAQFGNGTRQELGVNTTIYGHAMTDDQDNSRYEIKFGPLHDFRNPSYAENTPYIFFSTGKESMAFEVIAVFVANSDNLDIPYNSNVLPENSDIIPENIRNAVRKRLPTQEAFVNMVREQVLPRSKYNYNVEIQDDDKFLTLSTCIYTLDNGTDTGYPKSNYRYAVMARLVDPDEPVKITADFTINDNPLLDPDGAMASKQ